MFGSVLSAKDYHVLCGFSATDTGVSDMFLVKRNATGLNASRDVLQLILASRIATPHSAYESGLICRYVKEFLLAGRVACLSRKVLICPFVKLVVYRTQRLGDFFLDIVKRYYLLLAADSAYENA